MKQELVNYPTAAIRAKVSVSTLMKAVQAGDLTRHKDTRDKRKTLLDMREVNNHFNDGNTTFEVTLAEVATALAVTSHTDPELYHAVRRAIDPEHLPALDLIVGGDEGVDALDAQAGYTPEMKDHAG